MENLTDEEKITRAKFASEKQDEAIKEYAEIERKIEEVTKDYRADLKELDKTIKSLYEYIDKLDAPVIIPRS